MEHRTLGDSALRVSAVGLGCNNFGTAIDAVASQAVVHKALDLGITLFDTADFYGKGNSEVFLGRALGNRRNEAVIATKFGMPMGEGPESDGGGSRAYVMRAAEASLRRLNTDHIDLYQMHRPDPATPLEETMRALEDLIRQGKVRYIGHSNFTRSLIDAAASTARAENLTPFISAQNRYSLLTRDIELDLVPACEAHGVGVLPYFPLESGLLSGKYPQGASPAQDTRWAALLQADPGYAEKFFSESKFARLAQLQQLCAAYEHDILQMAFGWLLTRNYVASVIAGATRPQQIEQNVKASAWRPSAEEAASIDAITSPQLA